VRLSYLFRRRDAAHGTASNPQSNLEDLSRGTLTKKLSPRIVEEIAPKTRARATDLQTTDLAADCHPAATSLAANGRGSDGRSSSCRGSNCRAPNCRDSDVARDRATQRGYHPKLREQPDLEHLRPERRKLPTKCWRKSSLSDAEDAICGH
jgi:hypothetical protein